MYRYQHRMCEEESVYIAGPECFYTYGYDALEAMRARAQSLGFHVTLPNDHPLDMDNPDKQKRADSIFEDLRRVMLETTVIVADLEAYRGAEPDAGTVYELGMAYAKGAHCYGYSRDKRSLGTKNQKSWLKEGKIWDERGMEMPYAQLPFSPAVVGSTRIVEGGFDDCLKVLILDLEEKYKFRAGRELTVDRSRYVTRKRKDRPLVYLADFVRYDRDAVENLERMKRLCAEYGYEAVTPLDPAPGVKQVKAAFPYTVAANMFDNYQQHVRNCDIVLANLNNFRGYEISSDVAFECGMGFQLGKKLYGFMEDTGPLIDRIPNFGEAKEYRDQTGSNVENFDYPANLMFASSMRIVEGDFEAAMKKIVESEADIRRKS